LHVSPLNETRRAVARLVEHTIAFSYLPSAYQVPLLRQEPEPCVEQVRVTVPSVSLVIVKWLPDFDDAEIV
jgi:hypothetical protein